MLQQLYDRCLVVLPETCMLLFACLQLYSLQCGACCKAQDLGTTMHRKARHTHLVQLVEQAGAHLQLLPVLQFGQTEPAAL